MSPLQVFRHVVLRPALQKIWPALSSQIVIVMLGSAVCSQIAAQDLTYAANFIQGRNFRAFEVYLVSTVIYLLLSLLLRQLLRGVGRHTVCAEGAMIDFTLWDIVRNLLLAARWTVLLSLVAFVGGGVVGLLVLLMRTSKRPFLAPRHVGLYRDLPGHAAADAAVPGLLRPRAVRRGRACVARRRRWR